MADNVTLNAGAGGDTCAADDVGGVKYQRVKLDVGGDGLSVPVVTNVPVADATLAAKDFANAKNATVTDLAFNKADNGTIWGKANNGTVALAGFALAAACRALNFSTRPAVSRIFSLPV